MNLEEALRMSACRTNLGSLCADYDMTAVAALPNLYLALFENLCGFYVIEQSAVAFLVVLFNLGYKSELLSELVKALLLGCLCEALIHISPLVILSVAVFKNSAAICS